MSGSLAQFSFKPDRTALTDQPLSAIIHIRCVLRLSRDTGETHIVTKLVNEARFVLFKKFDHSLHGRFVAGNSEIEKEGTIRGGILRCSAGVCDSPQL
jgi:hypothetical protein